MDVTTRSWWEAELAGCVFADARLEQRWRTLVERINGANGGCLPLVSPLVTRVHRLLNLEGSVHPREATTLKFYTVKLR